jgi:chorismate mutase
VVVKNIIEELVLPDRFGTSQRPFVISGPCSAESREQVLETARQLSAIGKVHLFRAGIWKPRTRPHTFEGKGAEALQWLSEVKKETGLPVATEVANAAHVESSLKANLDVLWIGARTTVSPFAVQEIADALEGTKIPVIVKNPIHADLKLWMGAIERVVQKVGGPVWALHRGFSSYGLKEFRNAPMWEIPIGLRAEMPEIPLLCDPSHISGNQTLIPSVAQKAMDLGMHGLMIESHTNPQEALSDAQQQVTPEHLSQLLDDLMIRDASANPEQLNGLEAMRLQMDSLDEQLIELLHGRMDLARSIGRFKSEHGMTILQLERWQEVMKTRSDWGQSLNLGPEFTSKLLEQLHKESIRVQNEEMIKKNNKPK